MTTTDTFGYNTSNEHTGPTSSPAKIPKYRMSNGEPMTFEHPGPRNEYEFLDLNNSDLTNLDMTIMTIEYRVMDGWDNLSTISSRHDLYYFYESQSIPW